MKGEPFCFYMQGNAMGWMNAFKQTCHDFFEKEIK